MQLHNPYSDPERQRRLITLSTMPRVWGTLEAGPCDTTPGLIDLARDWIRPWSRVVEVGCYRGVSTRVLACFAGVVYAVDAWGLAPGYAEIPAQLLAQADAEFDRLLSAWPNIHRLKMLSAEAARVFGPGSVDLVYLDGEHQAEAFAADVAAWLPVISPTGTLCGHDLAAVLAHFAAAGLPTPAATYADDSWALPLKTVKAGLQHT